MPYPLHVLRRPPSPIVPFGILVLAALSAGLLPDVQWRESAALTASVAALASAYARRFPTMLIAAAVAAGLAPAGLLLAPLCTGLAIRHDAARPIPVAVLAGALAALPWPWTEPSSRLPNLALVATGWPDALALIVATGVGLAVWLAVRAASRPTGPIFAEARLGALLLATVLPLPIGALGFIVAIAALPVRPASPRMAANDNVVRRTIVRLAT